MLGLLGNIGPTELIIILVIALLVFGRRLPEVGRSLGRGLMEFKKGLQGVDDEVTTNKPANPTSPSQPPSPTEQKSEPPQASV
jgi:sec-independent protein translocase protein TatA